MGNYDRDNGPAVNRLNDAKRLHANTHPRRRRRLPRTATRLNVDAISDDSLPLHHEPTNLIENGNDSNYEYSEEGEDKESEFDLASEFLIEIELRLTMSEMER